jgi:hypothetical protein
MMHGFFSKTCTDLGMGTCFWQDQDGNAVEVTAVYNTFEEGNLSFQWKDKEYVGLVTKYLRAGRPDTRPQKEETRR